MSIHDSQTPNSSQAQLSDRELLAHLNRQTAKIAWEELVRYFAQGLVYRVTQEIDLLDVAVDIIRDNKVQVTDYLDQQQLVLVDDDYARVWHNSNSQLWAVVAAPWVLVQEITKSKH